MKESAPDESSMTESAWSEEMDAAHVAYGTAARVKIIRQLRVGGPMTRSEIAGLTAIGQGLTAQCLNRLKSLGVVTVSVELPQLPARERLFGLDAHRADQLLNALTAYVRAGNPAPGPASGAGTLTGKHSTV